MSLEYLESEEKEEYISIREKSIAYATLRALEDLMKKVKTFRDGSYNKADAIRFIDHMKIKHYELIVEEMELFSKSVEELVNADVPIDYKAIIQLIESSYKTNFIISKKKVSVTPDDELKYEQLKNYIKEETK